MNKTITAPYDVADYLQTPEDMADYLDASIEEARGDVAFIARAIGDIARAEGISQVAQRTGISCESLAEELSGNGTPSLDTVLKVLRALGLRLNIETIALSGATSRS